MLLPCGLLLILLAIKSSSSCLLLALVEDLSGGLLEQVVDLIVAEEQVVGVEQVPLLLVGRVLLVNLRDSDNLQGDEKRILAASNL